MDEAIYRQLDEWERLGVLTAFYRHLDAGDVEALCDLLDPQIRWLRQGRELSSIGEVRGVLEARDFSLKFYHVISSVIFRPAADGVAEYSGYLTVVRAREEPPAPPHPVGLQTLHVCQGALRRQEGRWRILRMNAGPPRVALDVAPQDRAAS